MARTISVADDVFEWMKEEKGEKSYSEFIRSLRQKRSNFKRLNGINSLGSVDEEEIEDAVAEAEGETISEIEERFE